MSRRVVVSGGGTGIGLAVARRFVADGDQVTLIGRREDVLRQACAELSRDGVLAGYLVGDMSDPAHVTAVAEALAADGSIDVLVANAGGNFDRGGEGLAGTAEDWRANFEGNVLTTVLLAEALLPHLRRPGGRIVTIGSVAGVRGAGSYGAAKAAVHNWSIWLAMRVAAEGITVNAVAPGLVADTEFGAGRSPEFIANRAREIPAGRPGTPEEVAVLVAHLASPLAGWTTGQIFQINGGVVQGWG